MRAFFDAGEAGDAKAALAAVTEDFTLFESGREEHIAHMVDAIERLRSTNTRIRWTLSNIRTRTSGDIAALTYRNDAVIAAPGAPAEQRSWLESAVLVRDGRWRLAFLHSTPIG